MANKSTTPNDQADPTFNQLLSINNEGTIAGYFDSGTPASVHPNKGYTLSPPYSQGSCHNENFPGSQQTQVTGINNTDRTVGCWADANGDNCGFVEHDGRFTNVVDPNAPKSAPGAPTVEQLLRVNDHDTDINDKGQISGFVQNGANSEGFFDDHGKIILLAGPSDAMSVQALGLNNQGEVVGSFTDQANNTHGFVYDVQTHKYQTIDDPHANGLTVINGINDKNQLVGFY